MRTRSILQIGLAVGICLLLTDAKLMAQAGAVGTLHGRVTVKERNVPLQGASVQIVELNRATRTDADGYYEFRDVPAGYYDVISHMHALMDDVLPVEILAGQSTTLNFQLTFQHLHHEVTVTASGKEQTSFDSFQAVSVLDTIELASNPSFGLGELTDNLPGVAKRSFGPGSSRPVLRGFDGDRVLVLTDGLPTGTLSSQSGEHAEPIDGTSLDRLEIVKGPATLLYGSNAIGGVVNAVTQHHLVHEHPHEGLRANLHASAGANNNLAAGGANMEYGVRNWLFWGGGTRQITSDYHSPEGRVENSLTRLNSGHLGVGWFGAKPYFTLGYAFNDGRFGVPFAGEFHHHEDGAPAGADEEPPALVDETFTWQNVRVGTGVRAIGSFLEAFRFAASFARWMHKELENDVPATAFDNKLWSFRGTFEQSPLRRLSGSFGFQGSVRDYLAQGEEALSPPVASGSFALFALEEIPLERARMQFGGRIEHTLYRPEGLARRSFTGASGAVGFHLPLWKKGVFVANYTHSYRAPALEELYNNGPHIGNLAFEVGDPNLKRETSEGLDVSFRHDSDRVKAEANFYHYWLHDFVYLALTGEMEHGLRVAEFAQADARFTGAEASLDIIAHPNLWLNLGMDTVRAEFASSGGPLPRIPPLRGRLGFDVRFRGFSFKPELRLAADQSRIYPTETPTPGYGVVNLTASYIFAQAHRAHVFTFTIQNAGDRLYRNHLSFIKDLAPEMGRDLRFSYNLRFF
jgi:iron complex outermembrane receptor protein